MKISTEQQGHEWLQRKFPAVKMIDDQTYAINISPFEELAYGGNFLTWSTYTFNLPKTLWDAIRFKHAKNVDAVSVMHTIAMDIGAFRKRMKLHGYRTDLDSDGTHFTLFAHRELKPHALPGEVETILKQHRRYMGIWSQDYDPLRGRRKKKG